MKKLQCLVIILLVIIALLLYTSSISNDESSNINTNIGEEIVDDSETETEETETEDIDDNEITEEIETNDVVEVVKVRNYTGDIDDIGISMHLEFLEDGQVTGLYAYDQYNTILVYLLVDLLKMRELY